MRLRNFEKTFKDEKRVLRNGFILLTFAAVLVVLIFKIDVVWNVLGAILGTAAPLLYGIIMAYILNVLVSFFEKVAFRPFKNCQRKFWLKAKRPLAIGLSYLIVFLVVILITCFIVPGLMASMTTVVETAQRTLPGYIDSVSKWVTNLAQQYDLTMVQDFIKNFNWGSILSNVTKFTSDFLGSILNVTANLASGIFASVMGFIFSIYLLFGKEKLLKGLRNTLFAAMPKKAAFRLTQIGVTANKVFYSFIRGQLMECVILGGLCYIGMSILGLEYALLISSVITLSALIPILGAYIGAAIGAFILLLVSPLDAFIFLVFLLALQQIESNLIYPRVVGSSIGLPPVWTMFAVLFWGGVLGITGILIGTPVTAVLYKLLRSSVRGRLREKDLDPDEPGDFILETDDNGQQRLEDI